MAARPDPPQFWIVAGANGSGKSTLYDRTDIEGFGRSVWIINPDMLSARIAQQEHVPLLAANGQALDRIWAWLEASIQAHQTVGVETVLSTGKYRALVGRAKALGFEIRLLYVFYWSNISRSGPSGLKKHLGRARRLPRPKSQKLRAACLARSRPPLARHRPRTRSP